MICYDRLWKTMEKKGISQYRLIKYYHFSAGQIGRLKKNMHVSTHTLDTLCSILGCGLSEIVEYVPEGGASLPISEYDTDTPQVPAYKKEEKSSEKSKKKKKSDKKSSKGKKKGKEKGKNR